MDNIEKLIQLKKLYESGIITKEELEAEKAKVLQPNGHINQTPPKDKPKPENEVKHNVVSSTRPEKKQPEETIAENPYLKWGIIGGVALLLIIMLFLTVKNSRDYTDNDPIILEDDNSFNTNTSGSRVMTLEEYIQQSVTDTGQILNDIWKNEPRAKSKYIGATMSFKLTATKLGKYDGDYFVSCQSDEYRINDEYQTLYFELITDDQSFFYMDFPTTIYVEGTIESIYESYLGYNVNLNPCKLLMAIQNGQFIVYNDPLDNNYGFYPGGLDDDGPGADEFLY